ncbi:MAG: hypothetical protein K8W52_40970 [Deltaproteobacteria bacterium]|nr:hypothetical protein [Deltaproteobacteria bacterium]
MSWFDGLGSGIGSLVDMFTGMPGGTTAAGASAAASGIAGSGAAQKVGTATGLTPYMKLLGMTPSTPAKTPEDRVATPSELADLKDGLLPPTAGGDRSFTNKVTGNQDKNSFKTVNADGTSTYKMPSYANWDAVGKSSGNRQGDIDARDKAMKVAAPEIYQPDLSKLKINTVGQKSISQAKETSPGSGKYENLTGAGVFHEGTDGWQSAIVDPTFAPKTKIDPLTGKGSTSIASGGAQTGFIQRDGVRAVAMSDDKRYTADAEAGLVTQVGASGSYGLDTKNGAFVTGGVGGKIGGYAQGNANAKTKSVKVGGVDYDAGAGVHGEVFAGAKAGAGGTVGIGPDFVGAKGNIGAFIGAEAAGDVHANLGPLAGKLGASGMVGAGIGADGDISYKDGKFHVGGKMFAALGYGGSLSADMTVDVGAIGKTLANVGSTGLDYAGKGLSAAGDLASKGLSTAGNAISSGASSLYNGATSLFSW